MQKKETAIEVKVGALVIFALALLVAFVVVLGDFSLDDGHVIYVDFDHAGGLKQGADVAIAGIKAGKVEKLQFKGGEYDEEAGREVMVRAAISLETDMADAVRNNSEFFITTQGVLGEKYVEIITPNLDEPAVKAGAKLRGIDPPRMEILLARAASVLEDIAELLSRDDVPLGDLIRNLNNLAKHTDEIVVENRDTVRSILANVDAAAAEVPAIATAVRDGIGDGAEIRSTLRNVQNTTATINRRVGPLADKAEATLDNAEAISTDVRGITSGKRDEIEGTIDNVYAASGDARVAAADVRGMTSDVRAGKGTIGGLMTDQEIYDDLKEMLRELKRRPWKIIWKE